MKFRGCLRRWERYIHLLLGAYCLIIVFGMMLYIGPNKEDRTIALQQIIRLEDRRSPREPILLDQEITPVILVTRKSREATLMGDILQQAPGVFYVFEPLYSLYMDFMEREKAANGNAAGGNFPDRFYYEEALPLLRAWLTCDFTYLTADEARTNVDFFQHGQKTSVFVQCVSRLVEQNVPEVEMLFECVSLLKKECLSSRVRVIKTPRLDMKWVAQLFGQFSNLKIIYFLQDPRANLATEVKHGYCASVSGMGQCAKSLCSGIYNDLLWVRAKQQSIYNDQTKLTLFKHFVMHPIQIVEELYRFIGIDFLPSIEYFVHSLVSSGKIAPEQLQTWSSVLNDNQTGLIQKHCQYLLSEYNYTIV